ncbi:alpha/beta fold hydrolase [Salinispirillum marinum]|uniref:Alpha/beta fold hydrolase n=2 Tax=Saccharospirillaceae TaxID=255527 RepID=A0ABV8BFN8_9GAMM
MTYRYRRFLGWSVLLVLSSLQVQAEGPDWYGALQPGGYLWVVTPDDSTLRVNGDYEEVTPPRTLVAFGRDESGQVTLELTTPEKGYQLWDLMLDQRNYREQRVNGVPPNTVSPSPEEQARIARDSEALRMARASVTQRDIGASMPFAWPLYGRMTGVYGSRRWYNGEPGSIHWGIDIARPTGTPVFAPADGRITLADDLFLSGKTILLDHGQQLTSSFLHLSELTVQEGDRIRQGDMIGRVGTTGRSTGPHLDWRMDWRGVRIDPALWVPDMEDVCTFEGDGDELVIVLHGLGRTPFSMNDMADALVDAGYSVCNQGYPSRDATVQMLSSYVASAVQKARAEGKQTVHFVTHSMGGILVRYYLTHSSHELDGRVVMLAPPNQGSEIVDTLEQWPGIFEQILGPAARQLSTDADSLPNQLPPLDKEIGVLAGDRSSDPWFDGLFRDDAHDGKVSVESTRLLRMTDHRVVPAGHTFIMNNNRVQEEVLSFLRYGHFLTDEMASD